MIVTLRPLLRHQLCQAAPAELGADPERRHPEAVRDHNRRVIIPSEEARNALGDKRGDHLAMSREGYRLPPPDPPLIAFQMVGESDEGVRPRPGILPNPGKAPRPHRVPIVPQRRQEEATITADHEVLASCCSKPPRPSGRFPGSDRLDRLPCLVPLFFDLMGYVKRKRSETGHPLQHRHQRLHLLRVARTGDDGRQDPAAPVGTCHDTHVAAGFRNCGEESRHVLPMISLIRKRWPNLVL